MRCSYIVLMRYTVEWRRLRNWKVRALRMTAAEGLKSHRVDSVLRLRVPRVSSVARLLTQDPVSSVAIEAESSGASVVGRSNQNRHRCDSSAWTAPAELAVTANKELLLKLPCRLHLVPVWSSLARCNKTNKQTNSVVWVCEQTIPTERPPLVGEVIANFCG
jgi:hypothetical protein